MEDFKELLKSIPIIYVKTDSIDGKITLSGHSEQRIPFIYNGIKFDLCFEVDVDGEYAVEKDTNAVINESIDVVAYDANIYHESGEEMPIEWADYARLIKTIDDNIITY